MGLALVGKVVFNFIFFLVLGNVDMSMTIFHSISKEQTSL